MCPLNNEHGQGFQCQFRVSGTHCNWYNAAYIENDGTAAAKTRERQADKIRGQDEKRKEYQRKYQKMYRNRQTKPA